MSSDEQFGQNRASQAVLVHSGSWEQAGELSVKWYPEKMKTLRTLQVCIVN